MKLAVLAWLFLVLYISNVYSYEWVCLDRTELLPSGNACNSDCCIYCRNNDGFSTLPQNCNGEEQCACDGNVTNVIFIVPQISSPIQDRIYSEPVPINVTINTHVEKLSYSLNSGSENTICEDCDSTYFILTNLSDGHHSIKLRFYLGDMLTTRTVNFKIDTIPPIIHEILPHNNSILNSTYISVRYTEENLYNIKVYYEKTDGNGDKYLQFSGCHSGNNVTCTSNLDFTGYKIGDVIEYAVVVEDAELHSAKEGLGMINFEEFWISQVMPVEIYGYDVAVLGVSNDGTKCKVEIDESSLWISEGDIGKFPTNVTIMVLEVIETATIDENACELRMTVPLGINENNTEIPNEELNLTFFNNPDGKILNDNYVTLNFTTNIPAECSHFEKKCINFDNLTTCEFSEEKPFNVTLDFYFFTQINTSQYESNYSNVSYTSYISCHDDIISKNANISFTIKKNLVNEFLDIEISSYVTIGSEGNDKFVDVRQTPDKGHIILGVFATDNPDMSDYWLVKIDSEGQIEWQKTYDGGLMDRAYSVDITEDGGYIFVGSSGDYSDIFVLKTGPSGDKIWERTINGGSDTYDTGRAVRQTKDGNFIVGGIKGSFLSRTDDFWLIKLDNKGDILWNKTFDGCGHIDNLFTLEEAEDGGYIFAGNKGFCKTNSYEAWIIRTDSDGNEIWNLSLGNSTNADNTVYRILKTDSNSYILSTHRILPIYQSKLWLIKIDDEGSLIWEKGFDLFSDANNIYDIALSSDDGYIFAGNINNQDIFVFKTGISGNLIWNFTVVSDEYESVYAISQTDQNGLLLVGDSGIFPANGLIIKLIQNISEEPSSSNTDNTIINNSLSARSSGAGGGSRRGSSGGGSSGGPSFYPSRISKNTTQPKNETYDVPTDAESQNDSQIIVPEQESNAIESVEETKNQTEQRNFLQNLFTNNKITGNVVSGFNRMNKSYLAALIFVFLIGILALKKKKPKSNKKRAK